MNAEGMFERLKLHTTRTLEGKCWDLTLLAQARPMRSPAL